jgi:cobalt-zinc-cadmium efflux system membrane fusion protein
MRDLILICVLLAGCGSGTPQADPVKPAAEKTDVEAGTREIVLDETAARKVSSTEARQKSVAESIDASGRITANQVASWQVGAVVEGRVIRLEALVGQKVARGQILAGMHSHQIHEARADYRRAESERERAQAALSLSERQRDRAKRLLDLKAGSVEQLEHTEAEVIQAQAALRAAEVELVRVRKHLTEFLQVPLQSHEDHKEGEFEHEEDLIPVKAPAAGTIVTVAVTAGTVVTPGQPMFTLSDLTGVWMLASVPERHLGQLRVGAAARVMVQAEPGRSFPARVAYVADRLDPATRTLEVRLELANPRGALKPEMYATAEIPLGGARNGIFVPSAAIQSVGGAEAVFVETGQGRYTMRPVQTGRALDGSVEIVDGLAAGERVVTTGAFLVKSQMLRSSLVEE